MKFKQMPYLEFKKVEIQDYDRFIKNRKYIQVCKQRINGYIIIHIAIYRENCKNYTYYIEFSLYKEIQRYKTNDPPHCLYYEIVSKKQQIQDAMEERALNLIIQKIIGDKYFTIAWKSTLKI
jgi:hypothetical protein